MVKRELRQRIMDNREAVLLLGLFAVTELSIILHIWNKPLIWDTAIYLAMGKHLFSGGAYGLWEVFRPPVLPVIAGITWKLGIPPVGYTRLLAFTISISGLAGIYWMVKDLYSKTEAYLTAGLVAGTFVYFNWTSSFLTGIPASMLVFTSIYLVHREKYLLAGLVGGLAFLTRFPAAVIGPALVAFITYRYYVEGDYRKIVENSALYTAGFFLVAVPYLAAMQYFYGSFLEPFVSGIAVPASNADKYLAGMYYLFHAVKNNPLIIGIIPGLYYAIKERQIETYGFLAVLIALYGFFTVFPHKEVRFVLLFLPLIALFAARGYSRHLTPPRTLVLLAALGLVMTASFGFTVDENRAVNEDAVQYYQAHSNLSGVVAANDASIMAYGDFSYFALPPATLEGSYQRAQEQADYFSINSCAWYCTPSIENCESRIDQLESDLEQNYNKSFEHEGRYCNYSIYRAR